MEFKECASLFFDIRKKMRSEYKIVKLLDRGQRKTFAALFMFVFVSAFFEMIGVVSIMPFIAVASNIDLIQENYLLSSVYEYFEFKSHINFLIFLGSAVLFLLTFSMIIKAISVYLQLRVALSAEFELSKRLMSIYLAQSYGWFVTKNTTDLGKNILAEVSVVITQGLIPLTFLVAQSFLAALLLLMLVFVDYQVALISATVLLLTYLLIYQSMRKPLRNLSRERFDANELRYKKINDAFGSLKLMKIGGTEQKFIKSFEVPASKYASSNTNAQAIAQIPRFIIEAIAFGGLIIVIIVNLSVNSSISNALPIIALYALSGYKLIPAIQQIYWGASQIKFAEKSIGKLYDDLKLSENVSGSSLEQGIHSFDDCIELKSVSLRYPGADKLALNGVDLKINKGERVALIGKSGSGKTTAVDVLLALLEPTDGALTVDGQVIIERNKTGWQSLIGYVPQDVFIKDSSIAENIAYTCEDAEGIDQSALRYAAQVANLDVFITQELQDGYNTHVGDRGMRLSGGQRQRIGIARALYHRPKFLVLDEGTSALDRETEHEVIQAISQFPEDITVLMITHRAESIKNYDKIYMFENGKIVAEGSYEFLTKKEKKFADLNRLGDEIFEI